MNPIKTKATPDQIAAGIYELMRAEIRQAIIELRWARKTDRHRLDSYRFYGKYLEHVATARCLARILKTGSFRKW